VAELISEEILWRDGSGGFVSQLTCSAPLLCPTGGRVPEHRFLEPHQLGEHGVPGATSFRLKVLAAIGTGAAPEARASSRGAKDAPVGRLAPLIGLSLCGFAVCARNRRDHGVFKAPASRGWRRPAAAGGRRRPLGMALDPRGSRSSGSREFACRPGCASFRPNRRSSRGSGATYTVAVGPAQQGGTE